MFAALLLEHPVVRQESLHGITQDGDDFAMRHAPGDPARGGGVNQVGRARLAEASRRRLVRGEEAALIVAPVGHPRHVGGAEGAVRLPLWPGEQRSVQHALGAEVPGDEVVRFPDRRGVDLWVPAEPFQQGFGPAAQRADQQEIGHLPGGGWDGHSGDRNRSFRTRGTGFW